MNNNLIIKNIGELVTCSGFAAKAGAVMSDLGIVTDGALVIQNGLIAAAGKTKEALRGIKPEEYTFLDAKGKAVLPGFVDSHTHFIFNGYRADEFAWRLAGVDYMEIMNRGGGIARTVVDTRKASRKGLAHSGRQRLDSMLSFGVTTVEGKSGYGLDRETEIRQLEVMALLDWEHHIDIVRTFLGAHALPVEYQGKSDAFLDFLMAEVMPEVAERNLAEFCDIFCEKNVFSVAQSRRYLQRARELGFKLKIHADEMVRLGGAELAAELGAVSADHLLRASDKGVDAMAKAGIIATLLPLTAFSLKEPYASAREMIKRNCAVALATDLNPGSCFSESIPLLFALATLYMEMTPEEAVTALTINGAAAVGRSDTVGSLDVGKKGDAVILEFPSYRFLPYHIGVSAVEKVIKNGRLVYDKGEGGIIHC